MKSLRGVGLALVLVACGGGSAPKAEVPAKPVSPSPAAASAAPVSPPKTLAPLDVDPVVAGLGRSSSGPGSDELARAGIQAICDDSIARAESILDEIRALDTAPDATLTWDTVGGRLDKAKHAMANAGDFPALMAVAHPDDVVREKAKLCEPKIDALDTGMWLDAKLARVVKRYAAKKESLSVSRQRFIDRAVRDFHRNGLDLDDKGQQRLRAINVELTALSLEFDTNLAESHLTIEATPKQLEGLPKEWLASHPPNAKGVVTVTTDYPDYFPVLTYAKDRKVALDLFKQFENRAADKNVTVIEKMLALRQERAHLLGYATWADYILEDRMAKKPETVAALLDSLRKTVAKKGDEEMAEFKRQHVKLGGKITNPIPPSDRLYLEDQIRNSKYNLDSKEVSKYFEVTRVKAGLLDITAKMFGIKYRPSDAPTWHKDVEAMEVTDLDGKVLGRFYFDLYPREGKYKHAAVFGIRDTMKMGDGSRLMPIAAIECNFPKPGGAAPALMSHQDAVTFFHEFGHVIHHILSEAELSSFAGTSVARDFVEAPSQMLEEWAWNKDTLAMFARHHDTNAPLPAPLYAAMVKSRGFGRALATQRQLYLAALDQAYHTRTFPFDTTKVLEEINDMYTPFKYVPGTHFQASFGHLIGYDAGYYGYQWALSIAQDLFTRFKKEGLLNLETAASYRKNILAPGDSDEAANLIKNFLGRPPSDAAYKAYLLEP